MRYNANKEFEWSKEQITVGRWMSLEEYLCMVDTGMVQESISGTTHVAIPPDKFAFYKQAKKGAIYVEFDVPSNAVRQTGEGWAKILGPKTPEARLFLKNGLIISQMPLATNIKIIGEK